MTLGIDGWGIYCRWTHDSNESVSFSGVNCTIFRCIFGSEGPQSVILVVGAFPESKIVPRCKKKKRDYKVIH